MGEMHDLFDGSDAEQLPRDADVLDAWNEIMAIAIKNALVVAAVDGIATIALPSAQIELGWYERCQYNHRRGHHPKTLERDLSMKAPNA